MLSRSTSSRASGRARTLPVTMIIGRRPYARSIRPALAAALVGVLIACSADAPAADLSAEELFGVREVLAEVRTDGVRLVAGYAPAHGGFDGEVDFVLAGAVRDGDDWRVRLVEPLMGGTCGANTVERLVPDEPSIVATCLTGGTNRVGYVAVLGTDP